MRRILGSLSLGTLMLLLSGCSVNSLIWGNDGAEVIETTERLVSELATNQGTDLLCADSVADLGQGTEWMGLAAGEPEKFSAQYWPEQATADPQWSINLEGLPPGATPGTSYPGDIFYRQGSAGLCVVDVAWATLISLD